MRPLEFVKNRCRAVGKSMAAVAKAVGLHRSALNQFLTTREMPEKYMAALARELRVDVEELRAHVPVSMSGRINSTQLHIDITPLIRLLAEGGFSGITLQDVLYLLDLQERVQGAWTPTAVRELLAMRDRAEKL